MNHKSERKPETGGAITIGLPELMARLNSGRQTAEKVAAAAGAKIKIGRRTLYHVGKIEAYIEQQSANARAIFDAFAQAGTTEDTN